MSDELLQETFRCERYAHLFPTGMPMRACLRRQLERQPAKDPRGKVLPLADWPATKPYCANECLLGRANLAAARKSHVPAETCLRCGAAQVGERSAAACPGCPEDEKQVPRGALSAAGPGKSERLWSGEVPEVPIAPPGKAKAASGAALGGASARTAPPRVSTQATRAAEQVNPEEPAKPAEEDVMPRGKREKPWPCCGSHSHRHLKTCDRAGTPAAKAKPIEVPVTRKAGVALVAAPVARRPAPARRPAAAAPPDLTGKPTVDLLALRDAVVEELRRRLANAQDEIVALKAAVGSTEAA